MKELNERTIEIVEKCVCGHFGVDYEATVVSMSLQRDCSNARHFIISILHDKYGYSSRQIAEYYGFGQRYIKGVFAKVRSMCEIYKEYKKHYDVITTVLLDLDFA